MADRQQLTPAEELRVLSHEYSFLVKMQWEFQETLAGRLDVAQLPLNSWRGLVHGRAPVKLTRFDRDWETLKGLLDPAFVEFFEENVVNHPPD